MLIDIAILPPQNISKSIGNKIKKEIGNRPNCFVVDNVRLFPHLSLWHMKTSKKGINIIAKKLERITKGQKQIKISSSGFHALKKYPGCVEFEVKINNDLTQLQQKVFQNVHSYKSGVMPEFAPFIKIKYSDKKLQEINKWPVTRICPSFYNGVVEK